jgi:hypothetical protein
MVTLVIGAIGGGVVATLILSCLQFLPKDDEC